MKEGIEIPQIITVEELVRFIDSVDTTGPEAERLIGRFVDQCFNEAEALAQKDPDNPVTSNRANIRAQITIAIALNRSEIYRAVALSWLQDARLAASQDDSTSDLRPRIESAIRKIDLEV